MCQISLSYAGKLPNLSGSFELKLPVCALTMQVYVVTGGNRGLGLEHVREFLEKTDAYVIATTRHVEAAHNLQYFVEQGKADRLTVVSLDLEDEESIQVALSYLPRLVKNKGSIMPEYHSSFNSL